MHLTRFLNRDSFARFSGIGIGCQQLQASHTLEILIGPDAPDPVDAAKTISDETLLAGCYKIDDKEGVEL